MATSLVGAVCCSMRGQLCVLIILSVALGGCSMTHNAPDSSAIAAVPAPPPELTNDKTRTFNAFTVVRYSSRSVFPDIRAGSRDESTKIGAVIYLQTKSATGSRTRQGEIRFVSPNPTLQAIDFLDGPVPVIYEPIELLDAYISVLLQQPSGEVVWREFEYSKNPRELRIHTGVSFANP